MDRNGGLVITCLKNHEIIPLHPSSFLSFPDLHLCPETAANGMDWPQWRGPNRDGFVPKDSPWPSTIDGKSLTQSWQAKLGKGYPGPVLSEELVFTIESVEGNEVVHALDRKTGEIAWKFPMGRSNESPLLRC